MKTLDSKTFTCHTFILFSIKKLKMLFRCDFFQRYGITSNYNPWSLKSIEMISLVAKL